ncbi:hypothetical protein N7499_012029 [Penicillium canescens]|nr:hypothetical protein N7522_011579 [Penicillium canescens]KAJ6070142.1 hypothetical protein N7499_012029 [Penicillium canescens]KAJ6181806.1 hypothetical protein N7485_000448 [Penicillium canescens]
MSRRFSGSISEVITIARIQFCDDQDCGFASEQHLLIQLDHIPLDGKLGVALSYSWGEFNRQEVAVGHDVSGNVKKLELGQEWHVGDLQASLADLSQKYGGCWMDQLCIKQAAVDIRKSLANIPSIYRTLNVVVLVPSSPCSCSEENARLIINSFDSRLTAEVGKIAREHAGYRRKSCLNSSGLISYFDRVWTRQEFMYSRQISLLRTSKELVPCVRCEQDVESLGTYAGLLFQRNIEEGQTPSTAYQAVKSANTFFFRYAMDAMISYCAYEHASSRTDASYTLSKFLLGETIVNQQPAPDQLSLYSQLKSFLTQLSQLGRSARRATKECDYVLSVWVDCPGYVIPTNYKSMDLPELLEDAILQLEKNLDCSPLVTVPAALFGRDEAGGLWRPTTYLQRSAIHDARELYNVLSKSQRVPVSNGSIPLTCFLEHSLSVSSRADDYIRLFEGWPTAKVFDAMKNVCSGWPEDVLARVRDAHGMPSADSREHYLVTLFAELVVVKAMNALETISRKEPSWEIRDTDHHDAMYGLVAIALGISRSACEAQGLRLMVSLEYPPCIGFMKPELSLQEPTPTYNERVQGRQGHNDEYLTVCTAVYSHKAGCALLEAAIEAQGPPVVLKVSGIWVPMKYTPLHEVAALAQTSSRDGRLGGPSVSPAFDPFKYLIYIVPETQTENIVISERPLDDSDLPAHHKKVPATSQRPRYLRLVFFSIVFVYSLLALAVWTILLMS